uniref:Uncharacterized protein n=1 Tax=Picea glauca TaxID=3330 RepID=A0A101LWH0_PICGL|nr:hypothetical protein ABT39_MTgene1709 [Picea glauca]
MEPRPLPYPLPLHLDMVWVVHAGRIRLSF